MARTITIRSGGQTGVDRAALATATVLGLTYKGWCPKGGWAEDHAEPPGVRKLYPALQETPSADPRQRTAWNVRESDATLILAPGRCVEASPGTRFTRLCAELVFTKPCMLGDANAREPGADVVEWLTALLDAEETTPLDLNVAGPRESEVPGIRARSGDYLLLLLRCLAR